MKVFLSRSTKDADFVKQLAAIIGARSEAWLCEATSESTKTSSARSNSSQVVRRCAARLVA
jgi:hypothetical protein